jgi:MFS family permease
MLAGTAVGLCVQAVMPDSSTARSPFSLRVQSLSVPLVIRREFFSSAAVGAAGFAVSGVLAAVTGLFLRNTLDINNLTVVGLVIGIAFVAVAVGQLLIDQLPKGKELSIASVGMMASAACIAWALMSEQLALLIVGAVFDGLSTGFAVGIGLSVIAANTLPQRRGETVSAFFVILYAGLSLPVIGVGVLIRAVGLVPGGVTFSFLVALLAALVLISVWKSDTANG